MAVFKVHAAKERLLFGICLITRQRLLKTKSSKLEVGGFWLLLLTLVRLEQFSPSKQLMHEVPLLVKIQFKQG